MSTKVMLNKISLEGNKDVMAFLGEQDARTFSQILFAGKYQYTIIQESTDVDELTEDYSYAVSNDSGDVAYDIVFFRERKMRDVFILTLMYAMAGASIEDFDLQESRERLLEIGDEIDQFDTGEIPLSWIKTQAADIRQVAVMA